MKTKATVIFVVLSAAAAGNAQERAKGAQFEVASIKPCDEGAAARPHKPTPGRLRLDCVTAEELILSAHVSYADGKDLPAGTAANEVVFDAGAAVRNGPKWLANKRFTIEAKAMPGATYGQMQGPMMQRLLKERFALRFHQESRTRQVYELIQDRGGAKLTPAKPGNCIETSSAQAPPSAPAGKWPTPVCGGYMVSQTGGVDAFHLPVSDICRRLSWLLDRPVLDRTGLTGIYDIHFNLSMSEMPRSRTQTRAQAQPIVDGMEVADPTGSFPSALRKLGLCVRPTKGTATTIVIDSVQLPTAN